jgi:hypothetical protein
MAFYNDHGVIAEQYSELQALPVLEAAKDAYSLGTATAESTIRAIFQAAEITLLNLDDLVSRAATDIEQRAFGSAAVKMSWARGFQRVMVQISFLPDQLGVVGQEESPNGALRISDSPALRGYFEALKRFDKRVLRCIETSEIPIEDALAERSLDSAELHLLHLARICNHETTIWERNLARVYIPAVVPSYEEFVVSQGLRDAVYDRVLRGDTFFTQFRGLHQVPEILCTEINDRLEKAILEIRMQCPRPAYEHLRCANILAAGVLAALPPMADNLVTSDYHKIRENLGLTSGSHSVNLHYHLFRDLYQQLWQALGDFVLDGRSNTLGEPQNVDGAIREAIQNRHDGSNAFLFHLLADQCLQLRAFTNQWREEHLQLPRNNLGGSRTKSLTGSLDAIKAVKGMRDAAREKDPMQPLAKARELNNGHMQDAQTSLSSYFESPASLDARILDTTGSLTQKRFQNVQQRLGVFATQCPFTPPPRRVV